jgi:TPR repeat protein
MLIVGPCQGTSMKETGGVRQIGSSLAICILLVACLVVPSAWADFNAGFGAYQAGDYASALTLLRPEAEAGNPIAQNLLGVMNAQGKGTGQNDTEAVRWYRMSANRGYAAAQTNLGLMYQQGRGLDRDLSEARNWYTKAANQGDQRAREFLRRLERESTPPAKSKSDTVQETPPRSAKEEATFFMDLVAANNGKAFCLPPKATMGEAATALQRFTKAHGQKVLTEAQMIAALATIYPCTTQK